jgi:crotonobetainyl-CoA:carnitine CoA-transferase CaiB-like acyl-CoA transferase
MVMGPTCGLVLGDLGAEVIKIEPPEGDQTRRLLGSGAGFYPLFNRNKKSIALDLKTDAGREAVLRLIATADVLIENFKTGAMEKLGLGEAELRRRYPRLIYVSHKGFLPGPYADRTALDEVVQMMGGLAYMTGRPGDPLRAGSSVNDIMGGLFGAIGVMSALAEREKTGVGKAIQSSLFENNIFLVAQHMMQYLVTGKPADPMPARISAWGIYDIFPTQDGDQIFLGVVSDTQWEIFCKTFQLDDLWADTRLSTNNGRVTSRDWLIPHLRERLGVLSAAELAQRFERAGLPFAPITAPHELLEDPHLIASGGLVRMRLPDGERAGQLVPTALLPLTLNSERLPIRMDPPALGQHNQELLQEMGYSASEIQQLSLPTTGSGKTREH